MKIGKKNKLIWIYWHQGWVNAPEIIQKCRKSWIKNNPQWEVKSLDFNLINDLIDIKIKRSILNNLCIAHQSDIIRLHLLEKYGGVWVDASLFCIMPLDNWLNDFLKSGLFMFESSTKLTIVANWFIATRRNNPIIKKLRSELTKYWTENIFIKNELLYKSILKLVKPILNFNKRTARLWLNPFIKKYIKVYPYQIFYFIFEKIISENKKYNNIWNETPKLNKYICWPNQKTDQELNNKFINRLNKEFVPLIKLDWRLSMKKKNKKNSLIDYLSKSYL